NLAVNRITRQLFTTNRLPHDTDTIKLTNSRLTQINRGNNLMRNLNRLPTRASVLPLLSNIPSIRTRIRNRRQILLTGGRMRRASPTVMRLIVRGTVRGVAVEIGAGSRHLSKIKRIPIRHRRLRTIKRSNIPRLSIRRNRERHRQTLSSPSRRATLIRRSELILHHAAPLHIHRQPSRRSPNRVIMRRLKVEINSSRERLAPSLGQEIALSNRHKRRRIPGSAARNLQRRVAARSPVIGDRNIRTSTTRNVPSAERQRHRLKRRIACKVRCLNNVVRSANLTNPPRIPHYPLISRGRGNFRIRDSVLAISRTNSIINRTSKANQFNIY